MLESIISIVMYSYSQISCRPKMQANKQISYNINVTHIASYS